MIGRITAMLVALFFGSLPALADDPGGRDIPVAPAQSYQSGNVPPMPEVSAPPPPWVEFESTSIGAGIGVNWGEGTLLFDGERHAFGVKGLGIGDIGFARLSSEGDVRNLDDLSKFEGTYIAVEAGAAVGVGRSVVAMRNQHGVVITLESRVSGARLNLGPEGIKIDLQ